MLRYHWTAYLLAKAFACFAAVVYAQTGGTWDGQPIPNTDPALWAGALSLAGAPVIAWLESL